VIVFLFHHLWLICQLVVAMTVAFAYFGSEPDERSLNFHRRSDTILIICLIISGPLGCTAMLFAALHEERERSSRGKCRKILAKWEEKARAQQDLYQISRWEWVQEKKWEEVRYTAMRETVHLLQDYELKCLIEVSENIIRIDKGYLDAVADEIIYREIAKA
jgi:hypothetical protein